MIFNSLIMKIIVPEGDPSSGEEADGNDKNTASPSKHTRSQTKIADKASIF